MCQQCDIDSYGAYGGRWQRTNRDHGRVGSVFQPAGAQVAYTDHGDTSIDYGDDEMSPTPVELLPEETLPAAPELMPTEPGLPSEPEVQVPEIDANEADAETALLEKMLREDL